ncbi:CU044_2847 family protein [Kribbella speibonae]|uniref:CU044_2847 family protein n=1 Tax=Kribbella speibonae TaxID=1572660 RepID=UPI0013F44581|nr:CU044_2847 family protein [Kribbella speibonae]
MAGSLLSTELGGVPVLVETVAVPGTELTSGRKATEHVHQMFTRAQAVIEQFALTAVEIAERVATNGRRPDQLEVQFGLKFAATGDVVIASASTEASLSVKIVYDDALAAGPGRGDEAAQ